jgi:DNA repair photolyase
LVLRDLDILTGGDVCVGVTITTADEKQRRLWEPKASSVESRLRVLREAKAAGLKTAVMFGPLLPEISDTPEGLRELFALAAEARVDRIWTDVLNPRPRVWPSIQQYLRRRSPKLLEHYRRVLFDRAFRARYVKQLNTRIRRAAANAKVTNRMR